MILTKTEQEDLFHKIYYSPTGFMSAKELYNQVINIRGPGSVKESNVKEWIKKQKINQEHKNKQKYKGPESHFNVTEPNDTHQADVLCLPSDYGFKYVLNVIDVATRYKASQPLKNITGLSVMNAFKKIYETTLLDFPKKLMIDSG